MTENGLTQEDIKFLRIHNLIFGIYYSSYCKAVNRPIEHTSPEDDRKFEKYLDNISGTDAYRILMGNYEYLFGDLHFKSDLSKEHKQILGKLVQNEFLMKKIGSQMDQYLPNFLAPLEMILLVLLYRKGTFTTNEINESLKGRYNRGSIYNALTSMKEKGFVEDLGSGKKKYQLTGIGKKQAKWFVGRTDELNL